MIVLSSLEFMFRFFPIFLVVYFITPVRFRNVVMFAGSLIFYASGEPGFVILLIAAVILNYVLGRLTYQKAGRPHSYFQRKILRISVAIDAGILVVCKVLALAVNSSFLPIGMSFYIFKMISYQADLYRGTIRKQPTFFQAAAYFTMFPQLTQGPIMRYNDGHFTRVRNNTEKMRLRFEKGAVYFVLGLGMKVLLADRIGILWNDILRIGYRSISTPLAWMGAFGYTFQLYFDFWGYSLMASGAAMMLGFKFIDNFLHPYAANGIADFYRKWHATLGAWFKDYIYIPLGGSREGRGRTIRNLMIVWALTGLWHGGTLNFLIWGLVLGLLIVWEKFVVKGLMDRVPILGHLHVWILIPLTWVIFAISDLGSLGIYFARLFPLFGIGQAAVATDYLTYLGRYWPYFLASVLLCIPGVFRLLVHLRRTKGGIIFLAVIFWISVYFVASSAGNTFLYFNF